MRARAVLAVLLAAGAPLAGALPAAGGPAVPMAGWPNAGDALLAAWAGQQPADSSGAALAGLAGAALEFARQTAGGPMDVAATAASVEALVGTHRLAAARLAGLDPGALPPAPDLRPLDVLAVLERAGRGLGPGEAAGIARAWARAGEGPPAGDAEADPRTAALALAALGPGLAGAPAERPAVGPFADAGDALRDLLRWHGLPVGEEERSAIAALRAVPEPAGQGLARIIEGYLVYAEATRRAFAQPPGGPLAFDARLLVAARGAAAGLVAQAVPLLACGGTSVTLSVVSIDLRCEDSTYTRDFALLVDAGGSDIYRNNAGGGWQQAAMLLDLAGDDDYNFGAVKSATQLAVNGASFLGAGFLWDGAGNDRYGGIMPGGGANGAGGYGAGFLYDGAGDDTYRVDLLDVGTANGGALAGLGFLLDAGGDDAYEATNARVGAGLNGGAVTGQGVLVDLAGSDRFVARLVSGAANGGALTAASGFLYDGGDGSDTYDAAAAEDGALNGGTYAGAALLADLGGSDTYIASIGRTGAANGAALLGTALLFDAGGGDAYRATAQAGALNGAALAGSALLYDGGGDDAYVGYVQEGAVNGAVSIGLAVLADRGGTNLFEGSAATFGAANGAATGMPLLGLGSVDTLPAAVALLLAGPGDDTHVGAGTTQGAADLYSVGVLVDAGGRNTYRAGPGGLAQGAGRGAGLGIVVDQGEASSFALLDGAAGQGAGLQGLGLLFRGNEAGDTTYLVSGATARPSLATGAGLGLRLDAGRVRFSNPPTFACASPEIQGTQPDPGDPVLAEIHVCAPDDGAREAVVNPVSGEPLDPAPKPPLPCSALGLPGWADCTFLENDHIDPTTGGGLAMLTGKDPVTDQRILRARYTVNSLDSICGTACFTQALGGVANSMG